MPDETMKRVLIAGATGYLGKFAAQAYSPAAIEEIRTLLSTAAIDGYVAALDA